MNKKNIGLQGIPYDEKSSYQRGSALAPSLIKEALNSGSMNLFSETGISIESNFHDLGDFPIKRYFEIEEITTKHLNQYSKLLTLGGDHAITFPVIRAFAKEYPKIDILVIDAHPDLYDEFEGDPYSHACPFARIMDEKLAVRIVEVGIRAANPTQLKKAKRRGVEIHQMKDLDIRSKFTFENPLYISLDLDGIDPAFAPGVSHHEPGGLTSREVIHLIQGLNANIIGADIVEYNPNRDHQNMTAFLAAKLMKEIVAKMIKA